MTTSIKLKKEKVLWSLKMVEHIDSQMKTMTGALDASYTLSLMSRSQEDTMSQEDPLLEKK